MRILLIGHTFTTCNSESSMGASLAAKTSANLETMSQRMGLTAGLGRWLVTKLCRAPPILHREQAVYSELMGSLLDVHPRIHKLESCPTSGLIPRRRANVRNVCKSDSENRFKGDASLPCWHLMRPMGSANGVKDKCAQCIKLARANAPCKARQPNELPST
jgi:hypothetical protein